MASSDLYTILWLIIPNAHSLTAHTTGSPLYVYRRYMSGDKLLNQISPTNTSFPLYIFVSIEQVTKLLYIHIFQINHNVIFL